MPLSFIDTELHQISQKNLKRTLIPFSHKKGIHITLNNQILIDFSSNDYLGLFNHPNLIAKAQEYLEIYGAGSTASRLISGNYDYTTKLEQKLANLKGYEASLIFNSGFQANTTILPTISDKNTLILLDKLCHSSLILGAKLSSGHFLRYHHNDYEHLEKLISQNLSKYFRIIIVTESIFSMDGDKCDLDLLEHLKEKYKAILYIDEAHATGLYGQNGMGLTENRNVDISMGTFGKALGSFGAYIASSQKMKEYLINCCPGFIYSTALPPSIIGSMDAALDIIPTLKQERINLLQNAEYLRKSLHFLGLDTFNSSTQIIPIKMQSEKEALDFSKKLFENNIYAVAIRPPTVPANLSRIRFSLTALHTHEHIDKLVSCMGDFMKKNLLDYCNIPDHK